MTDHMPGKNNGSRSTAELKLKLLQTQELNFQLRDGLASSQAGPDLERERAARALRESEEKYRSLVECQKASIATLDENGTFHYINQYGALELDKTPEEVVGLNLADLLPARVVNPYLEIIRLVMRTGEGQIFEQRSELPHGTFWHRCSVQPVRDGTGQITLAMISGSDITRQKETELNLEEKVRARTAEIEAVRQRLQLVNQELARALRRKDEFLANMSHELRTPLNAILGISESLSEGLAGDLNDKQTRYVEIITESGQHLLSLINDILDISKAEAGKVVLERGEVTLRTLGEACLRLVREMAHKKHIQLSFAVDPQVVSMAADERRLKQILVNLLSNAVKFTPDGGRVGLEINGDAEQGLVQLVVWDTGIGIPPDDMDKLFRPFVQLNNNLTRENDGTGLGLALVARLISLHGGSITVQSDLGQGSRFVVALPWLHHSPETGELALDTMLAPKTVPLNGDGRVGHNGSARQGKILVVEDTDMVVKTVKDYLESHGYQVLVAANGMEGVAAAIEQRPDLVLMDVQMPVMNGLEAARHIRAEQGFENLPIVAMTALAMPGDRERCLSAGMDAYISKPIHLSEMVQMIRALLA